MTTASGPDELWIRFQSGPDIDALGLANADIIGAVEAAGRAHGEGRVVFERRVHLVPDNGGAGHFNILRGHLSGAAGADDASGARASGMKAVGDGERPGRRHAAERILFWHRGLSILDIAVGQLILHRAEAADAGTMLRCR